MIRDIRLGVKTVPGTIDRIIQPIIIKPEYPPPIRHQPPVTYNSSTHPTEIIFQSWYRFFVAFDEPVALSLIVEVPILREPLTKPFPTLLPLRRVDGGFAEVAVEFGNFVRSFAKNFCRHFSMLIVLVRSQSSLIKHVSIASKSIDGEVDDPRLRLAEIHFDPNTPWVCEEHVASFAIDILSVRSSAARRFFGVEPAGFRVEAVARSEIPISVNPFFDIKFAQLLAPHLIQDKRRHLPELVRELVGEFADGDFVGGDFLFALLFVFYVLLGKSKCFIEVGTEFFSADASFGGFAGGEDVCSRSNNLCLKLRYSPNKLVITSGALGTINTNPCCHKLQERSKYFRVVAEVEVEGGRVTRTCSSPFCQ